MISKRIKQDEDDANMEEFPFYGETEWPLVPNPFSKRIKKEEDDANMEDFPFYGEEEWPLVPISIPLSHLPTPYTH